MRNKNSFFLTVGCFAVTAILLLAMLSDGFAFVPQKINYQGTLSDSGGTPVTGSVTMVFSIYSLASGGTALWTETQSLSVNNGIYNVNLGDVNPISLPFDTQYYLGVRVGSDGEMIPRQTLTSVGYAFKAQEADSASDLSCIGCVSQSELNFTPGTITGVTAGTGLTGGGTSGSLTLNLDTTTLQGRVSSSCAVGSSIRTINSDGTVICQADTNSGGTVTSVGAGAGLTGGPITTTGTLSLDFAGTGSATTASKSDHNHDTAYQRKYGKVAVVAQSGGDYTSPVTAMNNLSSWCGAPSETNLCLVKIMPGVYDIGNNSLNYNLPYVDIEGSGEGITTITGDIDTNVQIGLHPQGVLTGFSEIRFLSVENTGGGTNAIAISLKYGKLKHVTAKASGGTNNYGVYCEQNDLSISDVTAKASGGTNNYGVYNLYVGGAMTNMAATASGGTNNYGVYNANFSTPVMTNVTAIASGGITSNCGILNHISAPTMMNVTATASGGAISNGVYTIAGVNNQSPIIYPVMTNVTATASGGTNNYGFMNSNSSPTMTNVSAMASGGTISYGVYNESSTAKINHSVISATSASIYNGNTSTCYVGNTQLDGLVSGSNFICVGAYNGSYLPLNSSCQ
ncbi:MAG: hypothetical protein WC769_06360 [Thermodesulfovibrionales bacterium]